MQAVKHPTVPQTIITLVGAASNKTLWINVHFLIQYCDNAPLNLQRVDNLPIMEMAGLNIANDILYQPIGR